ncbi:hypothetical protein IJ425_01920 [bacterium]|nr:hypothetical protein [bacterium]
MLLNMEEEFLCKEKKENCYPYYKGSKSVFEKYATPVFDYYFSYNTEKQNLINEKWKNELEKKA